MYNTQLISEHTHRRPGETKDSTLVSATAVGKGEVFECVNVQTYDEETARKLREGWTIAISLVEPAEEKPGTIAVQKRATVSAEG